MLDFVNRFYPVRYTAFLLVLLLFAINSAYLLLTGQGWMSWLLWAALLALGIYDVRQTQRSILRNYPILGHLRFLLEYIRPEIRQYFIESESEAARSRVRNARWSMRGPRVSPTNARLAPRWTCTWWVTNG